MSYTSRVQIRETAGGLQSTYHKAKGSRVKLKIKALMLFKAGDFKKQEDLAYHLCIGHATLKRWLRKYKNEGLSSYIKEPVRGKPRSLVSAELHKALESKLKDSDNPLQSYLEAVAWVRENYGIEIKYHSLRKYLITNFKSKLKVPRKSHYKKDEQAIEAFFKTAGYTT